MTVAPRHPILSNGEVVKVDFQVSKKVNRLDNKVSGKGKRGAQQLLPSSPLCDVTCSTGEKYTLYRWDSFPDFPSARLDISVLKTSILDSRC